MKLLRIAAACLLDDRGRLLLVRKRGTRAFMLPGGKIEPDETPLAALSRELQEELQLNLAPSALQPLGRFRAPAANEPATEIDARVYLARLPHPVQAAAELEELRWHTLHLTDVDDLAPLLHLHVLPALRHPAPD
ncbi:MAG: NUDIX domain-containing protein [Pseudomonadaceae bacterium]|nr:NUDIX domain-containing protein [Pseudomonadaceae bacterium]